MRLTQNSAPGRVARGDASKIFLIPTSYPFFNQFHPLVYWEARFQELIEYKRVHGKYKVNLQLLIWFKNQRNRKQHLSAERIKKLDSIGFVWWSNFNAIEHSNKQKVRLEAARDGTRFKKKAWDLLFEQLREIVRTYKHCNVPSQHPALGRWAEEQRQG